MGATNALGPFPTRPMPVAAEVGCFEGHDHEVTGSRPDDVAAARAAVGLEGQIRVHDPHLDVEPEIRIDGSPLAHSRAQSTSAKVTASAAATRT